MREFLEVGSINEFYRLAEDKELILRIDPFLMIFHFGLVFYINMNKLSPEERKNVLNRLKHKIIYIKSVRSERTFYDFISEGI